MYNIDELGLLIWSDYYICEKINILDEYNYMQAEIIHMYIYHHMNPSL